MTDCEFLAETFTRFAEDYQKRPAAKPSAAVMGIRPSKACRGSFATLRLFLRESLEEIVKNTLGYDTVPADDADGFRAGMFLACPLAGGTGVDAEAISRITGIPKWQCARWIIRAQQLEIFSVDGGVFADPWVDPPPMEATINFMLDCMVLSGRFVRTGARGDKNSLYGLPEWSKS